MDPERALAPAPNGWLKTLIDQIIAGQVAMNEKIDQTHEKLDAIAAVMVFKADCDACKAEREERYVDKRLFKAGIAIVSGLVAVAIGMTSILALVIKGAELARLIGWT